MSSEDQVRPYHAGKETPGQEAADALSAVMSHAAEREDAQHQKAPPKTQAKWVLPLGVNLGVLALYMLIAPPAWVVMNPIEAVPVEEQADDMRLVMYMQALRVNAYRGEYGELPETLEDAGSAVPGVEYFAVGTDRYELITTIGEEVIRYDSQESPNEWVGSGATGKLLGGPDEPGPAT